MKEKIEEVIELLKEAAKHRAEEEKNLAKCWRILEAVKYDLNKQ